MISEIELYRLRDIAYKYLPAAQNRMLASNHRCDDYWYKLYSDSTMQSNMNLSAIEMSAIRLLQAVASYAIPVVDHNEITPEEHEEYSVNSITRAVKTLSETTGQNIQFLAPDAAPIKENKIFLETERNTMLKLIIGMAINAYSYDPKATKNGLTGSNKNGLSAKLMTHGISINDDTIRKYLNEAKELI